MRRYDLDFYLRLTGAFDSKNFTEVTSVITKFREGKQEGSQVRLFSAPVIATPTRNNEEEYQAVVNALEKNSRNDIIKFLKKRKIDAKNESINLLLFMLAINNRE